MTEPTRTSTLMSRAPVTIIVPTFNRAHYLPETIGSLLAQTVSPSQIIVVNDGSSDDTAGALAPWRDDIIYLEKSNGGKCSAINLALTRATGAYIWVFDDDDIACPDALQRHVEALESNAEAGYTLSGAFRCEEEPGSQALRVICPQPVRAFDADDDLLELMLSSYIAGPSTMIRRELIERVGPYREDLARVDDFEMAMRLALVSLPVRLRESRPTYYRRWHAGLRGWQGRQFAYAESIARSRAEERMVLRDLAVRLPLSHYLPRAEWGLPMEPQRECRAAIRRWAVAVQKAMWPEAEVALNIMRTQHRALATLPSHDLVWARRAFSDPNALAELHATPAAMQVLADALRCVELKPLLPFIFRQFYYSARAAAKARDLPRLRLVLAVAHRLFGIWGALRRLS